MNAGSAAAVAQATLPNVIAGSWFAIGQSAAAGGAGAATVAALTQAGGVAVAGAGGVLVWASKEEDLEKEDLKKEDLKDQAVSSES
jgi:hypothetical protein